MYERKFTIHCYIEIKKKYIFNPDGEIDMRTVYRIDLFAAPYYLSKMLLKDQHAAYSLWGHLKCPQRRKAADILKVRISIFSAGTWNTESNVLSEGSLPRSLLSYFSSTPYFPQFNSYFGSIVLVSETHKKKRL